MKYSDSIVSKVLTPRQVNRVCKLLLLGKIEPQDIAIKLDVTYWQINRIHNMLIHLIPTSKTKLHINITPVRYYKDEQEIKDSLNISYNPKDLKGWELETFKKL